jgi:hypothetical protein
MSRPAIKRSEYVEFGDRELESWPGVSVERDWTKRHMRVTVTFQGRSRFVIAPATGSDARGPLNHVQDLRQVLREIGAERATAAKSSVRRRRLSKVRAVDAPITLPSPEPLRKDPTRDPFAVLARLDLTPAPAPAASSPKAPWWRRVLNRLFRSAA